MVATAYLETTINFGILVIFWALTDLFLRSTHGKMFEVQTVN